VSAKCFGKAANVEHVIKDFIVEGRRSMSLDEVPPPGAALVEELDKCLLVQLRDGRKIVGILRYNDFFCIEWTVHIV